MTRPRILPLLLAMVVLVWGSTWLAIKINLRDLPGFQSVGFRFLLSGLVLFAYVRARGIPIRFDAGARRIHLVLAVFIYLVPYTCVYYGQRTVPSGLAAVVFATLPFHVALLGPFVVGERLTMWKLAGLLLGFAGIVAIHASRLEGAPAHFGRGLAVLSIAPFFTAVGTLVLKRIAVRENPLSLNVPPMLYGGLAFLAMALLLDDREANRHTLAAWLAILYLASVGTAFVFAAYFTLLRWYPVTRLAFTAFVTPLIAVFLGWLAAGETLGWRHAAGAALVLVGVAVSGLPYRPGAPATASAPAVR